MIYIEYHVFRLEIACYQDGHTYNLPHYVGDAVGICNDAYDVGYVGNERFGNVCPSDVDKKVVFDDVIGGDYKPGGVGEGGK